MKYLGLNITKSTLDLCVENWDTDKNIQKSFPK